jgi:DNA-binding NtrC family response regulator
MYPCNTLCVGITTAMGSRILIADDDALIASAMEAVVCAKGHSATVRHDGKSALDAYDDELHDLVITDARMPELNGIDLTRELIRKRPCLPVIIVTGYSDIAAEKGWENVIVLRKPVTASDLMGNISRMLSR